MSIRRSPRSSERALQKLAEEIKRGAAVTCITGAGLSADSGIPTFRHGPDAVWDERTLRTARREVFLRDPLAWYNDFWLSAFDWRAFAAAAPSAGHVALAAIARAFPAFRVVTQNIDALHADALAPVPPVQYLAVHGRAGKFRCSSGSGAGARAPPCPVQDVDWGPLFAGPAPPPEPGARAAAAPECAACKAPLLPEALLFDEDYDPAIWSRASAWLAQSKALVFVGSSNSVGFTKHATHVAKERAIPLFNFNLSASALALAAPAAAPVFHVLGPAAATLPAFAARLGLPQ